MAYAYGSVLGVAALAPRWTNGSTFDATTRPTLTQLEQWLGQASAIAEAIFLSYESNLPTLEMGTYDSVLTALVNKRVSEMVEGVNGHGRFGPSDKRITGERPNLDGFSEEVTSTLASLQGTTIAKPSKYKVTYSGQYYD